MKQQEEFFEIDFVKMRRWFPVLHLLRVPGMALDWRKLIFAALATLISVFCLNMFGPPDEVAFTKRAFGTIFFGTERNAIERTVNSLTQNDSPWSFLAHQSLRIARPYSDMFLSIQSTAACDDCDWSTFSTKVFGCLAVYLLWSCVGLAICRGAGNEFVSGTRNSFLDNLKFALVHIRSVIFFLFLTCLLISFLWGMNAFWGFLIESFLGSTVGLYTGFIPTLISLGFFVILFGMIVGWPIMASSIAVDGSDGFDALSRSYNYVISQFIPLVFYTAVMILLGVVFSQFIFLAGMYIIRILDISTASFSSGTETTRGALYAWSGIIFTIVGGYGVSFFWSGMTVIYFLLRKAEDGTPLDEMYFHQKKETAEGVPLVGIAERNQMEKQNDV